MQAKFYEKKTFRHLSQSCWRSVCSENMPLVYNVYCSLFMDMSGKRIRENAKILDYAVGLRWCLERHEGLRVAEP